MSNKDRFVNIKTGRVYTVGASFPKIKPVRVRGVGRMADNPRALLVMVSEIPTDDELRDFHEFIREWKP